MARKSVADRRLPGEMSRLGQFMAMRRIKPKTLAEIANISRQQLLRLRCGRATPSLETMLAIRTACAAILSRRVYVAELFNIGEDDVLGAITFLTDAMVRREQRRRKSTTEIR